MKKDNSSCENEYKLKLKDFIPVIGLIEHMERCEKEIKGDFIKDLKYSLKIISREYLLTLYNLSILAGIGYGMMGLERLLPK